MLLALLSAALLPRAYASAPDPAALSGHWRLAEPRPTVQARVDAAIDAALTPFNLVVRGLAHPLLQQAAVFCDAYHTTLTPTSYTVGCDALGAVTAAFGQPPKAGVSADGHAYALTGRTEDDSVFLDFSGDAGAQHVRYRSGGDGVFLVRKTVHADRLDIDVTWEMRYLRE
jgi:hypothetical protein